MVSVVLIAAILLCLVAMFVLERRRPARSAPALQSEREFEMDWRWPR
jgi:hypothetical protein